MNIDNLHIMGRYRFKMYTGYTTDDKLMVIVCHDSLPFVYDKAELIKAEDRYRDYVPVAERKKCNMRTDELIDKYVSSIPDSDSYKFVYCNYLLESLRKNFFVFEVDTAKINSYQNYFIRLTNKKNNKSIIWSPDIEGPVFMEDSYAEFLSNHIYETEPDYFSPENNNYFRYFLVILFAISITAVFGAVLALVIYISMKIFKK